MGVPLTRLILVAVFLWLVVLIYIATVLVKLFIPFYVQSVGANSGFKFDGGAGVGEGALDRVKQAQDDVSKLRVQNQKLEGLLSLKMGRRGQKLMDWEIRKTLPKGEMTDFSDSFLAQREVSNGVLELGYKMVGDLTRLKGSSSNADLSSKVDGILSQISAQHKVLSADLWKMSDLSFQLKTEKLKHLSRLVMARLNYLQNPKDCNSAFKLLCRLNKGCGFGCQVHHVVYCFIVAYATQRTLIIDSSGWRYSSKGWDSVFLPVSSTCPYTGAEEEVEPWKGIDANKNHQIVSLPIVDSMRPRIPQLPMAIPSDLAGDLLKYHGNPPVWWIGQFMSYLMRLSPSMQSQVDAFEKRLNISYPIVGIHVRRTDKVGAEAQFHSIEEYMKWAMLWFDTLDLKSGSINKRRVYIATDDTNIVQETRLKYPSVEVYGDISFASSAQLSSRYSENSLKGIILDIWLLSKSQYIVCTFSSQVCRIAYELMQWRVGDAADSFHSLDDVYYFGGQHGHEQIAVVEHVGDPHKDEVSFKVGDCIGVAGNHWDGYSRGQNKRTGQSGLYPSYKVKERWRIEHFPTYNNVNI